MCFVGGVSDYQSGGFILLQSGGSARVSLLLPGRHTPQPTAQLHESGRPWRTRQLQQVNSALDAVVMIIGASYSSVRFRDDIRLLYLDCGLNSRRTEQSFLFSCYSRCALEKPLLECSLHNHKLVCIYSGWDGMWSLAVLSCTHRLGVNGRRAIYSVHALMTMTATSVQTQAIRASLNGSLQMR